MRISDWSSDVCSSDLHAVHRLHDPREQRVGGIVGGVGQYGVEDDDIVVRDLLPLMVVAEAREQFQPRRDLRSEEHTSELQSLMRISYAVFCLKNNKKTKSIVNCVSQ